MTSTLRNDYDHLFKVLCIGDTATGKSALVARYTEDVFDKHHNSTIGVDFKIKTIERDGKVVKLQIWDTAGQERFRAITTSYYRGADGVLIVYDVTNPESLENIATGWINEVRNYASREPKILLLGNKSDLKGKMSDAEKERVHLLAAEIRERLGNDGVVEVLETSAKTGANVERAFNGIVDHMVEAVRCKLAKAKAAQEHGERLRGKALSIFSSEAKRCESSWCCGLM